MPFITDMTQKARSPGDPQIIETGPSSRSASDSAAKMLGWFSIGLGLAELFAAERMTKALGMEGKEGLVRAYGGREIMSGMTTLSTETHVGIWSRIPGDVLDLATLAFAYRDDNPKKANVGIALAAVAGVMLLDIATAGARTARHRRSRGEKRDYSDRSGWPKGLEASRGAAADFRKPDDMRAVAAAVNASPVTGRTSPGTQELQKQLEPAS